MRMRKVGQMRRMTDKFELQIHLSSSFTKHSFRKEPTSPIARVRIIRVIDKCGLGIRALLN